MVRTRLNLDDFPDSPYARQLRDGVSTRAFDPSIEADYLIDHLERVRTRVRVWYTFAACMVTVFGTLTIMEDGWLTARTLLHLLFVFPVVWGFVVMIWTRHYERGFMKAAPFVSILVMCLFAYNVAEVVVDGLGAAISTLVAFVFAAFFFSGMLYRAAVGVVVLTIVVYAVAILSLGYPVDLVAADLTMLLITAVLSGIVQRDVAIATRRGFLEAALIRDLVARDGLTGVMNRRAFDEHLQRVWQQGLRDHRRLALLLVDVDHFKAFNDTHGHQAGDSALRQVAQVLQLHARRPLDLAARYGGEEFAVILYDLDASQLATIAEQIRISVEKLRITHGAPGAGPVVTVSIGVGAVEPAVGRSIQGAIQFADEALYQAKAAGRNRVVIRGDEEYQSLSTGTFTSPKTIRVRG